MLHSWLNRLPSREQLWACTQPPVARVLTCCRAVAKKLLAAASTATVSYTRSRQSLDAETLDRESQGLFMLHGGCKEFIHNSMLQPSWCTHGAWSQQSVSVTAGQALLKSRELRS